MDLGSLTLIPSSFGPIKDVDLRQLLSKADQVISTLRYDKGYDSIKIRVS